MIFEPVSSGGCRSYLIGCEASCAAALIDPELSQIDRYKALAARDGLRIHYLIDEHGDLEVQQHEYGNGVPGRPGDVPGQQVENGHDVDDHGHGRHRERVGCRHVRATWGEWG